METEGAKLIARLRARKLRVKLNEGKIYIGPAGQLTEIDKAAIKKHREDMVVILGAEQGEGMQMVLEFFPGARVISAGKGAVWPPEGGFVPPAARTYDPHAVESPTVACPLCGAGEWRISGHSWVCGRCCPPAKPKEGAPT